MVHSNLRHPCIFGMENHNKASLASPLCFRQNSNAYNFLSNENMTLKLHIHVMTHLNFQNCKGRRPFMNMVYSN